MLKSSPLTTTYSMHTHSTCIYSSAQQKQFSRLQFSASVCKRTRKSQIHFTLSALIARPSSFCAIHAFVDFVRQDIQQYTSLTDRLEDHMLETFDIIANSFGFTVVNVHIVDSTDDFATVGPKPHS